MTNQSVKMPDDFHGSRLHVEDVSQSVSYEKRLKICRHIVF